MLPATEQCQYCYPTSDPCAWRGHCCRPGKRRTVADAVVSLNFQRFNGQVYRCTGDTTSGSVKPQKTCRAASLHRHIMTNDPTAHAKANKWLSWHTTTTRYRRHTYLNLTIEMVHIEEHGSR